MPAPEVVASLATRFQAVPFPLGASVAREALIDAARVLRDHHGYRYYLLGTATERADGLEVLHAVRHPSTWDTIFLKVVLPKDDPTVDSLVLVWSGADWHEREIFDLFGVRFAGHPDLRRILLPDEYVGHPLRKDFPMATPWGFRP